MKSHAKERVVYDRRKLDYIVELHESLLRECVNKYAEFLGELKSELTVLSNEYWFNMTVEQLAVHITDRIEQLEAQLKEQK